MGTMPMPCSNLEYPSVPGLASQVRSTPVIKRMYMHPFKTCRAGVWATLQFRWIQLRYPVVCTALERLLFAGTLPVAAMILTWATLIAVGPSNAPFYQAALLSGLLLHSDLMPLEQQKCLCR